jgi:hypothetical protein
LPEIACYTVVPEVLSETLLIIFFSVIGRFSRLFALHWIPKKYPVFQGKIAAIGLLKRVNKRSDFKKCPLTNLAGFWCSKNIILIQPKFGKSKHPYYVIASNISK